MRIDPVRGMVRLTPEDTSERFTYLRSIYPAEFGGPSSDDIRQWHLAQAGDAEQKRIPFAAAHHLRVLLDSDPNNSGLRARLDAAELSLKTVLGPMPRQVNR